MNTNGLMNSGVLNNGEPRHCRSWDFPGVPKLERPHDLSVHAALYRRQKAHAPRVRARRGLYSVLNLLRQL